MNNLTLDDLLKKVTTYNIEGLPLIKKAYYFAEELHKGQIRQSGEPYITHPLSVAYILAEMYADTDTICAALLHDTLEDTDTTKEIIEKEFGLSVANLVDGVTKISKMNFSSKKEQNAANTRKIITSIRLDVRTIIIKLADRLHNMRTLGFKSEFKQKENSMETIEIFVPLAYLLGMYRIKSELEDLALYYLYPDDYKKIEEVRLKVEEDSKPCLTKMLEVISQSLSNNNVPHEIKVRIKNIYGIYKRLSNGNSLSDIHDLLSLKIMVDNVMDCYKALYLVHFEYYPVDGKIKDFICNPKTNMYQSLHTTLFGADERLVQTQIRTFDMDKIASFGLTAYWDINKGNAREVMQEKLKNKYQFFNSLVEIDEVFNDNEDFVREVKRELFSDKIYVRTTEGKRIELPKGSTPIDFAYKLNIGDTMIAAIVNDKSVEDDYILKNNDRVKIITDTLSYGPREGWTDKVKTIGARRKIGALGNNGNKS